MSCSAPGSKCRSISADGYRLVGEDDGEGDTELELDGIVPVRGRTLATPALSAGRGILLFSDDESNAGGFSRLVISLGMGIGRRLAVFAVLDFG
jgi:hypothetical protein